MRKRHLEFWITRRLTSLDICALTMFQNFNYSNNNNGEENKIMVRNEKLNYYKLVSTRDDGSYFNGVWQRL